MRKVISGVEEKDIEAQKVVSQNIYQVGFISYSPLQKRIRYPRSVEEE